MGKNGGGVVAGKKKGLIPLRSSFLFTRKCNL